MGCLPLQVLDACGKPGLADEARQVLARVCPNASERLAPTPAAGGSSPAGSSPVASGDSSSTPAGEGAGEGAAEGEAAEGGGGLKRAMLSELDIALMKSTARELERHGAQVGWCWMHGLHTVCALLGLLHTAMSGRRWVPARAGCIFVGIVAQRSISVRGLGAKTPSPAGLYGRALVCCPPLLLRFGLKQRLARALFSSQVHLPTANSGGSSSGEFDWGLLAGEAKVFILLLALLCQMGQGGLPLQQQTAACDAPGRTALPASAHWLHARHSFKTPVCTLASTMTRLRGAEAADRRDGAAYAVLSRGTENVYRLLFVMIRGDGAAHARVVSSGSRTQQL